MELKRIAADKKILLSTVLLLIVNVIIYIYGIYDFADYCGVDLSYAKNITQDILISQDRQQIQEEYEKYSVMYELSNIDKIKGENFADYEEMYQEEEMFLIETYPEYVKEYQKYRKEDPDLRTLFDTYNYFVEQQEYIDGFKGNIDEIEEKANALSTVEIFKQHSNQSNIDKTVKDYNRIKNIPQTIGNNKPITELTTFAFARYSIVLFAFLIVATLFEDRKKGLHPLIFSTQNGRFVLAMKRLAILIGFTTGFAIILNAVLLFTGFRIYGDIDFDRYIQSIPLFEDFTIPMKTSEFLIFYTIGIIIMGGLIALLIWLVYSVIELRSVALFSCFGFFAAEYFLYISIPVQSNLVLLKSMNVFSYFYFQELITNYRNITIFNMVINRIPMVLICMAILSIVVAILSVGKNAKTKPIKSPNRLFRFVIRISARISTGYHKIISNLSAIIMEAYKILFLQKGIVFLIAAIWICSKTYNIHNIFYSSEDIFLNSFYETYGGKLGEDAYAYLDDCKEKLDEVSMEYEEGIEKLSNGEITTEDMEKIQKKYESFAIMQNGYETLMQKVSHVKEVGERLGSSANNVPVYLIQQRGYEYLFGREGKADRDTMFLLFITSIILLFGGTYSFENKFGTTILLKSTKEGRNQLVVSKILMNVCIMAIFFGVFSSIEIFTYSMNFGFQNLDAPIQYVDMYSQLDTGCSILVYMLSSYMAKFLLCVLLTLCVSLVSAVSKYGVSCIILSIVFVVPSALYLLGLDFVYGFSLIRLLDILVSCDVSVIWGLAAILLVLSGVIVKMNFGCWKRLNRR